MATRHPELPLEGRPLTTIEGVLERIVYSREETAWSVVRLRVSDRRDPVTAVGTLLGVQPGENLRLTGVWVRDPKYGEQLRIESYLAVKPSTIVGIERYLGSGLVPGIGAEMARRLVEHFGLETLDIIENAGRRLTEVDGIGPIRAGRIVDAWARQRDVKEVMIFLQSHGVSTAYAARIYKKYGRAAVRIVRENPYQLALDISGIGFKTADRIAENLGIARTSPRRAEAGVLHALGELSDEGHVSPPKEILVERARALLEVTAPTVDAAIRALSTAGLVVVEPVRVPAGVSSAGPEQVSLDRLHRAETRAASRLAEILTTPAPTVRIDVAMAIAWFERVQKIALAEGQKRAITAAITSKATIITGGPGTGKTTIVRGLLQILQRKGKRIVLAAPTGRAAKRLQEATGRTAKTLHRLLEFDPAGQTFIRNAEHPLETDVVIVDEVSMIDVLLFDHLLQAVPLQGQLVLVGDVDQLPSVGPGSVLRDIIRSKTTSVATLDRIFRQSRGSLIVTNAHRINRGEMPALERSDGSDFFLVEREDPEDILTTIKELASTRIPRRFGLDPVDDIQVLTPMHRGSLGAANLNAELQTLLNPIGPDLTRGSRIFRAGDKVMQLRNNYDLGVFNGDIGRIREIDPIDHRAVIRYDDRDVSYDAADLDELSLAYACSIHKSQGSEYPAVILPLSTQHYVMLRRNLLYTAVTRGRDLVVVVGPSRALALAVQNHSDETRHTGLERRLTGALAARR